MRYPERKPLSLIGFAGAMDGDDHAEELGDPGSTVALGLGVEIRRGPNLALRTDLLIDSRDYDVPEDTPLILLGTVDDLELKSTSALFSIKGVYPVSRFEPFVGAGLGLNVAELELTGTLLGFPGTIEKERDFGFIRQWFVGADFAISSRSDIGLELRFIDAHSDFGELSGGRVDIGGRLLSLTYRRHL
jgi:hypothetical protein